MPPPPKARWTTGNPTIATSADGTLTASIPLLDNKILAATIKFTLTADRALRIDIDNADGGPGLSNFEAWSDL